MKKISVIIPCYNTAETLPRVWETVKNQTIGPASLECVFVDDASTDGGATWRTIQSFEQELPETVLAIQLERNMRQGGARNVALQYISGKYLMFLDADDALLPYGTEALFRMAEENGADLIQFAHVKGDADDTNENRKTVLYDLKDPGDRKPFLVPGLVNLSCCGKLYRTELVRSANARFAEHRLMYEEPPFVYPQFFYANRIILTEQAMYRRISRPESVTKTARRTIIPEHAAVQLGLLSDCMERPEIMSLYRDEITFYFLWSFYYETLRFAELASYTLPADVIRHLRKTCKTVFPEWKENPYIRDLTPDERLVFETIDAD